LFPSQSVLPEEKPLQLVNIYNKIEKIEGGNMKTMKYFLFILMAVAFMASGCTYSQTAKKQSDGIDALVQGDVEKFKAEIRSAYQMDPDDPYVMNNMGVVYEIEGNREKAREMYKKAAQNAGNLVVNKSSRQGDKDRLLRDVAEENLRRAESGK
jgi:Flp pilus assembly protein TadD